MQAWRSRICEHLYFLRMCRLEGLSKGDVPNYLRMCIFAYGNLPIQALYTSKGCMFAGIRHSRASLGGNTCTIAGIHSPFHKLTGSSESASLTTCRKPTITIKNSTQISRMPFRSYVYVTSFQVTFKLTLHTLQSIVN